MSRLSLLAEDDVRGSVAPDGPILRRNRRRALHPDAVADLLRERAARDVCARGPTHFGWAIVLWTPGGRRIVRETHPHATYAEACALRAEEMRLHSDDHLESVWLKQKTSPSDA